LQILGVDPLWFTIVTGLSIIVAVAFDRGLQAIATSWLRPDVAPAASSGASVPGSVEVAGGSDSASSSGVIDERPSQVKVR
jgi:hypothetical protein